MERVKRAAQLDSVMSNSDQASAHCDVPQDHHQVPLQNRDDDDCVPTAVAAVEELPTPVAALAGQRLEQSEPRLPSESRTLSNFFDRGLSTRDASPGFVHTHRSSTGQASPSGSEGGYTEVGAQYSHVEHLPTPPKRQSKSFPSALPSRDADLVDGDRKSDNDETMTTLCPIEEEPQEAPTLSIPSTSVHGRAAEDTSVCPRPSDAQVEACVAERPAVFPLSDENAIGVHTSASSRTSSRKEFQAVLAACSEPELPPTLLPFTSDYEERAAPQQAGVSSGAAGKGRMGTMQCFEQQSNPGSSRQYDHTARVYDTDTRRRPALPSWSAPKIDPAVKAAISALSRAPLEESGPMTSAMEIGRPPSAKCPSPPLAFRGTDLPRLASRVNDIPPRSVKTPLGYISTRPRRHSVDASDKKGSRTPDEVTIIDAGRRPRRSSTPVLQVPLSIFAEGSLSRRAEELARAIRSDRSFLLAGGTPRVRIPSEHIENDSDSVENDDDDDDVSLSARSAGTPPPSFDDFMEIPDLSFFAEEVVPDDRDEDEDYDSDYDSETGSDSRCPKLTLPAPCDDDFVPPPPITPPPPLPVLSEECEDDFRMAAARTVGRVLEFPTTGWPTPPTININSERDAVVPPRRQLLAFKTTPDLLPGITRRYELRVQHRSPLTLGIATRRIRRAPVEKEETIFEEESSSSESNESHTNGRKRVAFSQGGMMEEIPTREVKENTALEDRLADGRSQTPTETGPSTPCGMSMTTTRMTKTETAAQTSAPPPVPRPESRRRSE
eukprot:Polyplicarium_translucidae@DN3044_c1_g1_i7.p1